MSEAANEQAGEPQEPATDQQKTAGTPDINAPAESLGAAPEGVTNDMIFAAKLTECIVNAQKAGVPLPSVLGNLHVQVELCLINIRINIKQQQEQNTRDAELVRSLAGGSHFTRR